MNKTDRFGYFTVKGHQGHLSMNAWYNLKKNTGLTITEFLDEIKSGDQFDQVFAMCDIIYASIQAYNQEEGKDTDVTIFQIRDWVQNMDEKEMEAFTKVLVSATSAKKDAGGKQKAAVKKK